MKYTITYLETALADALEIKAYLDRFYPSTAEKFFAKMEEQVASLETRPLLWPEHAPRPGYRKMVVENYLVFYVVDQQNKGVEIRRILHGARDIKKFLEKK